MPTISRHLESMREAEARMQQVLSILSIETNPRDRRRYQSERRRLNERIAVLGFRIRMQFMLPKKKD